VATELPTPKSHQKESRSEICVYESTDGINYFVEYHIPLLEYAAHVTYVNKEPIMGIYIATPNSPFVISAPSKPKIYMRSKFIHFLQIFRVLLLASPFGTSPSDTTLLFPTGLRLSAVLISRHGLVMIELSGSKSYLCFWDG